MPNLLTDEEHKYRTVYFIETVNPDQTASRSQIDEMFLLYNDRMQPRENGKACGGCKNRVYNRLKKYYEDNYASM